MNRLAETPDFRPLYAQVKEMLLRRVADGHWRPGELLPSEMRLAEEFGVSQGTVRKALDQLADQNLVVRRQGKGTFVTSHTPDRALFHFFHLVGEDGAHDLPESLPARCRAARASRAERARLGLDDGGRVVRITRVRTLQARPVMTERIAVPEKLFPGLAERDGATLPNTLYALYEQDYALAVAEATECLRAVPATASEARALELAEGTPLLEIDRIARGHAGQVLEWRVTRVDTARHHYVNELV